MFHILQFYPVLACLGLCKLVCQACLQEAELLAILFFPQNRHWGTCLATHTPSHLHYVRDMVRTGLERPYSKNWRSFKWFEDECLEESYAFAAPVLVHVYKSNKKHKPQNCNWKGVTAVLQMSFASHVNLRCWWVWNQLQQGKNLGTGMNVQKVRVGGSVLCVELFGF